MSSLQDAWEAEKTLPGSWLLGCSLDTSTLGHQDVPPSLHKWIRLENKIKTSIGGINPGWRCCLHLAHDAKELCGGTGCGSRWIRSPANHGTINKPTVHKTALGKHQLLPALASQGRPGLGRALNKIMLVFCVFYQ